MTDAHDLILTYIVLRLFIFSKAISGISLIRFSPRNLKHNRTYTCVISSIFYQIQLDLMALRATPRKYQLDVEIVKK